MVRHVEEFNCSLADCLERRQGQVLLGMTVTLCGLDLQSLRLPSREPKGIHLLQGGWGGGVGCRYLMV